MKACPLRADWRGLIDDCWRRAREVAARVLANDMLAGLMRDVSGRWRSRVESGNNSMMGAVATWGIFNHVQEPG